MFPHVYSLILHVVYKTPHGISREHTCENIRDDDPRVVFIVIEKEKKYFCGMGHNIFVLPRTRFPTRRPYRGVAPPPTQKIRRGRWGETGGIRVYMVS